MRLIKLSQCKYAMVDDEDFNYLSQWKWSIKKSNNTFYARRVVKKNGFQQQIYMHRLIMETPNDFECDHEDGNGLNCQKDNLRNCTHQQNSFNTKPRSKTGFKGVSKNGKYIRSVIEGSAGQIHLVYFVNEELAAIAYNKAALKIQGRFSKLNNVKL